MTRFSSQFLGGNLVPFRGTGLNRESRSRLSPGYPLTTCGYDRGTSVPLWTCGSTSLFSVIPECPSPSVTRSRPNSWEGTSSRFAGRALIGNPDQGSVLDTCFPAQEQRDVPLSRIPLPSGISAFQDSAQRRIPKGGTKSERKTRQHAGMTEVLQCHCGRAGARPSIFSVIPERFDRPARRCSSLKVGGESRTEQLSGDNA